METSQDNRILFAGGSDRLDIGLGIAKLFSLTFDENISYIDSIELPGPNMDTMGVSDIKRMLDRDVIFVGANMCLFVVEWTGSHFEILNLVNGIHSCKFYFFEET